VSDACTTAYGERDTLTKSLKSAGLAFNGWPRGDDAKTCNLGCEALCHFYTG
jgi:hypothetical protein